MISNDLKRSLAQIYQDEGYVCPLCTDVFDQDVQDKKPAILQCAQHSICIGCFKEYKSKNLNACPICRKAINLTGNPEVSSTIINAMDMAKKVFLQFNKPNSQLQVPAAAPKQIPQVLETKAPPTFECITFCEEKWNHRDVQSEIESIIPAVVTAMNWQGDEAELRTKLKSKKDEWILYVDKATQTPKGFTCLENPREMEFVVHWTGITEKDNLELYADLFKHILKHVENKRKNTPTDWRDVSLSIILSSTNEQKFHSRIAGLLLARNMVYDSNRIVRHWGVQRKLTVYPCEGPYNQPKNELTIDETKAIEFNTPYLKLIQPKLQNALDNTIHLRHLFALTLPNQRDPNQAIARLIQEFNATPENFFIYTMGGKAVGFIQFVREQKAISVVKCCLLGEQNPYANHFLEQFMQWSRTNHSMGKGVSAEHVRFPYYDECPLVIQKAINRAMSY